MQDIPYYVCLNNWKPEFISIINNVICVTVTVTRSTIVSQVERFSSKAKVLAPLFLLRDNDKPR